MALNPHVPLERDWDAAPLTRQVRASAGLRYDHLSARRASGGAPVAGELDAVVRYLSRFSAAAAGGRTIPWGHEPIDPDAFLTALTASARPGTRGTTGTMRGLATPGEGPCGGQRRVAAPELKEETAGTA